ncbi:hypothetical protein ACFVXE_15460 [Streptomyces sp. NPDC058231]|uniref:hypothetical protein n=1 Tax=Streptomyces sp. NPDC058231 TaxID=3346392 RepID=UPI0036EAABB2
MAVEGFGELADALRAARVARSAPRDALHGIATLTDGNRLRPGAHRARVDLLIEMAVAGT